MRDLTFAIRTLRRSPAFAATAALTIALGVGATVAIFSVANAVLLRPLPYADPGRLVIGYMDLRTRSNYGMPLSNENFADIRDGTKGSFEDMAAVVTARQVLAREDGTSEQVRLAIVTTNFFRTMGARIIAGRDFGDADGEPQPAPPTGGQAAQAPPLPAMVILSYEFWQRRFGGDQSVLGRNLPGGGPRAQLVVGVLAPRFELLFRPEDNVEATPDIWVANRLTYDNANRNTYGLRLVGRLRPRVSLERAQAEAESVAAAIRNAFPVTGAAGFYARLVPMHAALVEPVRPAILALMGAVIFLLLIACANVANLLLVRASLRGTEMAVRSALGAGRWQLVRQMLAEALVISVVGTVIGVALAWAGIRELVSIAPEGLPRLDAIRIDPRVLAFAASIGLASAVIFGLVPVWGVLRADLMNTLRGTSRTAGLRGSGLLRNLVVVAEVALCFVLLIGSGLMFRSFLALQRIDPGFDARGMLTFQLFGGRGGGLRQQPAAYAREIQQALEAIPGVQRVTASFPFPLAGNFSTIRWGKEDALTDSTKYQAVDWQAVLPGYFETMRTPLVEGRVFTDADNDPKRAIVVVDQLLAAKAFPRESAIGKRILIRIRTAEPEPVEIIGVVAHQRFTSLAEAGREQLYVADQLLGGTVRKWAVRTSGDPASLAGAARTALLRVDPKLVVADMQPMEALVRRAQAGTRFSLVLIGVFAAIAAALVAVGLYGVLSTVVRQRTAEIGVRMALGAAPASILRLVVSHGLRLTVAGIVVGVVAALALTRLITTMLIGVKPTDPATFVGMAFVFAAIAALSSWLPARRAAGLDPTVALRE